MTGHGFLLINLISESDLESVSKMRYDNDVVDPAAIPLSSAQRAVGQALPFEAEAQLVLKRVRSAFAAILQQLPGQVATPHDVARALDVHRKLGWQIATVAYGRHLTMAATHMPGPAGISRFLSAAARCNTPPNLIEAAGQAVEAFERLIRVHASDRTSLEMMVMTDPNGKPAEHIQLAHRKAAFAAGSCIWGCQARTQLTVHILHPAGDGTSFDLASLRGFIGFRRLRSNLAWVMQRSKYADDDGQCRRPGARIPLEAEPAEAHEAPGVPLLRRFCSQPLPRFRRVVGPYGFVDDELVEGPVGNTGLITFITGELARNAAPRYRDEHNQVGEFVTEARTPCEALVFDHFVHKDLFNGGRPELRVYSTLGGPDTWQERDRLPLPESIEYLGQGPAVLQTPDVPRYEAMARYVFDTLAWDAEQFDVYRARLHYPPTPTAVVIRYQLPERPR